MNNALMNQIFELVEEAYNVGKESEYLSLDQESMLTAFREKLTKIFQAQNNVKTAILPSLDNDSIVGYASTSTEEVITCITE